MPRVVVTNPKPLQRHTRPPFPAIPFPQGWLAQFAGLTDGPDPLDPPAEIAAIHLES